MGSARGPTHDPVQAHRWRIALLLGLGVLVNYFDRVNLSVAHTALYTTFGISDITFGYLSGAYSWTYALCQLPVGSLLDRLGVRRVGRVGALLWSVASFAAAAAPNLGSLFSARLLLGVGEAPTFPANAKAIGLWFPADERSAATAMFDAAAKLASALGVPLLGLVLLHAGWRWSFAGTGLISFGYFALFAAVYRDPPVTEGQAPRAEEFEKPLAFGVLLRSRKVLGLAIGMGAYNYVFYLLVAWLPSYLSFALHIDLLHSFLYTGVPWLLATAADLGAAFGADALIRRGQDASRIRKTVLILGMAFGLGIFGAATAHSAAQALVWITLSLCGLSAASPIGWSLPSMIAPRSSVGKVSGIVNFVSQLSGIAAPIVTGYIVQATHSYAWAFGVSGIYLALGVAAYAVMLGRIEEIPLAS